MSKEKGVLSGVFCSSVVAVLATVFVYPLAKLSAFIGCFLASCVANASVCLVVSKSTFKLCQFKRRNFLRRHFLRHTFYRQQFGVHPSQSKSKKNCRGMTLIEVLVTLVLLSVGLLGLAAMQVRAMQMNQGAYLRSQAVSLGQDMADRMRINRQEAEAGNYEVALTDVDGSAKFKDAIGDSDQRKLAKQDIRDWLTFVQSSLPAGDGSISQAGDRFTITLCWDDSRGQGTQQSQADCGADGLESNEIEVTL